MNNKHQLLGVPKHANQHRLSRLTMEVHTDELRIMASAVESYTDELIAALEAAEKRIAELEAVKCKLSDSKLLSLAMDIVENLVDTGASEPEYMVPVEPTSEMLAELCLVEGWTERALNARYQAMVAAAPMQEVKQCT